MKPVIDKKRTCKAVAFDFVAADYPDYAEPGASMKSEIKDHFHFACPGCGRSGAIGSKPGAKQTAYWKIEAGSLDDVTTLTLSPSINCTGCCGWHGYLKNGVFESC